MDSKDLSFGVEVETGLPYGAADLFPGAGWSHPKPARVPALKGWHYKTDSSVSVPGLVPFEFVSPVLTGETGLRRLGRAAVYMEQNGWSCNHTCGLHVNIGLPGGREYAHSEIVKIKSWVVRLEEGIYSLMGGRAEPRKWQVTPGGTRYAAPSLFWAGSANWHCSKYQSVNFAHSTEPGGRARVEFRLFEGKIDTDYLVDAVSIAAGIVSYALTTSVVPLRSAMSPIEAADAIGRRILGRWDGLRGCYPHSIVPDAHSDETLRDLRERAAARTAAVAQLA